MNDPTTNSKHPLLSYFGPADPPWSRILVIGREPDDERQVGTHAGPYELDKYPRTAFWTRSHAAISRACELPGWFLRYFAIRVSSSPIVYADASPRSYPVNSGLAYPTVTRTELEAHARNLCASKLAMACRVVIVSGRVEAWAHFYDIVEAAFAASRAAVVERAPFFGRGRGNENAAIDLALAPVRVPLFECVEDWCRANNVSLPTLPSNPEHDVARAYQAIDTRGRTSP